MKLDIAVNWIPLLAGVLAAAGLAVLLVGLAWWEFQRPRSAPPVKGKTLLACAILVAAGGLLYCFKPDASNLLMPKLSGVNPQACPTVPQGKIVDLTRDSLFIDPWNRPYNKKKKLVETGTVGLFLVGYARTGFYNFSPGRYTVAFQARGSWSKGDYAILKVEFQGLREKDFLRTEKQEYLRLTEKMKQYRVSFEVGEAAEAPGLTGWVRISFVNDEQDGRKSDRNAWIKDVKLWRK